MLKHPVVNELYPLGSIVESYTQPSNNWVLCDGSVVAQATYPKLYAIMDNPHPEQFQHLEVVYDVVHTYGQNEVAYGNSVWVTVSSDADDYGTTSDGETWNTGNIGAGSLSYAEGLAFNGTVFCTIDYYGAVSAVSSNGTSWTEYVLPVTGSSYRGVCWSGTYFCTAKYNTTTLLRSTDGQTWGQVTLPKSDTWYDIASDGSGTVVLVASDNYIWYSTDHGANWTEIPTMYGYWRYVTYENGYFFVTGIYHNIFGYSSNGTDWTFAQVDVYERGQEMRSQNDYMDYVKIRYLNGTYFYLSQGLMIAYSTDLKLWNAIPTFNLYFYDCFYNSSNEYYYFMTNCEDVYKTKQYHYDETTYFQLPYAYAEHSKFSNPQMYKWIRVR